ncbi:hypothetical protein BJY01DRAFT_246195 [Aspergillus pseudoustus]|uniref:F-box domain-containing protein n=1 Tax=Aspergillus pseudoustus TaxID=1810923 RepID=A0ABR4KAI8_9EURO
MSKATAEGVFDKLPYELRLQIWEAAISDGGINIMRASRAINEEIRARLYSTFDIHLSPGYNDPWMRVSCRCMNVDWTSKGEKEKTNHSTNNDKRLPLEKAKVVVHTYEPDPQDGAQLFLLWQKVRALVAILNQALGCKSVEGALRQNGEHTWHWVSKVTIGLTTRLADSDLLLVPFGRLSRVRQLTTTPSGLVLRKYNDIGALIADIDFFFETKLDTLRGRAAAMLRLERLARWFSSPWGKLPYEDQVLVTIRRRHGTVAAYDRELKRLRLRYNCFDTLQLDAIGRNTVFPVDNDFYWQKWLKENPDGVPRLSKDWLRRKRRKIYRRVQPHNCSANDVARLRQLTQFWYSIGSYLNRMWNIPSPMPLMFSVSRWC